jgi:hypothetical protein
VNDTREILESLRRYRKPESMDLRDGKCIFLQAFGLPDRLAFADLVTNLQEEGVGKNETAFRIAAFVAQRAVVKENGELAFVSVDECVKVLSDIDDTIVFDIAQRALQISGLAATSQEQAEKN